VIAPLPEPVRSFLAEPRFAVLATINRDGTPQQSVVWYELRGDLILMNTRRGRQKDRNLRRDPRCSLCVDAGYRYVTIRGSVSLIEDPSIVQADIRSLAIRYYGTESAERQMRDQFSREERVTIHLAIERVEAYGIREREP
jgi:PPOX class probable F420-dependent enzyme